MRILNTRQVTDPSILQPFTTKSVDFLQKLHYENTLLGNLGSLFTSQLTIGNEYALETLHYADFIGSTASGTFGNYGGLLVHRSSTTPDGLAAYDIYTDMICTPIIPDTAALNAVTNAGANNFYLQAVLIDDADSPAPTLYGNLADPVTFSDNSLKYVHNFVYYKLVNAATRPASLVHNGITYFSYRYFSEMFVGNTQSYTLTPTSPSAWTGTINAKVHNGIVKFRGTLQETAAGGLNTPLVFTWTLNGSSTAISLGFTTLVTKSIGTTFYDDGNFIGGIIEITGTSFTYGANWAGSTLRKIYFDGIEYAGNLKW